MSNVLQVEDLSVRFKTKDGEVKAVNGVSFDLKEDSILCLVGESGAGKSTTAMSLMGLLPRSARVMSGKVHFGGMDLLTIDKRTMRRIRGKDITLVPQEPRVALNPILAIGPQVEEQILAHSDMSKREAGNLAVEMLGQMGLPNPRDTLNQYPFQLSGGMCQRVMVAMALAMRPKVLIADEPTSNLDVTLQAEILQRLKTFCKELHASMILITHDMGVVAHMADEVAVMYAGSIVEYAEVTPLFHRPQHPYMWSLFQSLPRLDKPDRRFQPISGDPPDLMNLPGQCAYLPRCPRANNECRLQTNPPLQEMEERHLVACYHPVLYPSQEDADEDAD